MTDSTKSSADLYKDTVFLPKTDFPMRGELPKREPEILQKWQDMDLYTRLRETSAARPKWVLHDGPPYANGDIHMGHALNKTLKDVINRSWQMMGYNAPYVPGWDCHGLPIEWKIEEKYRAEGKNKDDVDPITFRAECRAFAQKWVSTQSGQFQRLGVVGDWKTPYLTMTKPAEAQIVREIHKFLLNGKLYKGVKPVLWSVVEKTALAEAEVEYKEHKSITVWVKFPIIKVGVVGYEGMLTGNYAGYKEDPASIVIWTTTPWTLPSNRAIAFGKDIKYGLYRVKKVSEGSKAKIGEKLVIAHSLANSVKESAKIEEWEENITNISIEGLRDAVCKHPLSNQDSYYDFEVPLLEGDFVTEDTGTGFVHIAPGHGVDDFNLVQMHNHLAKTEWSSIPGTVTPKMPELKQIEIPDNVSGDGKFRDHVPLFAGMDVLTQTGEMGNGNFAVLKALDEAGGLLSKGSLKHEYPHSWRSKAPLIFRTTPQWFIAMGEAIAPYTKWYKEEYNTEPDPKVVHEALKDTLRTKALNAINDTCWVPEKGKARITAMIENRPDWCISRQRSWGVPIALFLDKRTGVPLKDEAVLSRISDAFEKEGADAWWTQDAQSFLGDQYKAENYDQVFDIVDVWFESGSTHAFVLGDTKTWPDFTGVEKADLYLEGSDQHRGWFHSSLLESCGTTGHAPFKTVLTHGFVLDEKGYKMSKSVGNVVDPLEMIATHGADILRLWTMTSDYSEDLRLGKDTMKLTADLYRRLRNTFRYLLGALDGFTAAERIPESEYKNMPELEQLVLHWLAGLDEQVRSHIANYEYGKLTHLLHNFCTNELSAFYFDIRKDRLYCDRPDLFERRATRTVMAHLFECLTIWLAPYLCFTTEEAWSHRPKGVFEDTESVHLRVFPTTPVAWKNDALAAKWESVMEVRSVVLGCLEEKRADKTIGSSLEAAPIIYTNLLLPDIAFEEVCITSQASVFHGKEAPADAFRLTSIPHTAVVFKKAEGNKCQRSWKILTAVGSDPEYPDLSPRDADAVRWILKNKKAA
ncbi:MAG: isoleucine--tRNA ligase [Micavibrio sp.]